MATPCDSPHSHLRRRLHVDGKVIGVNTQDGLQDVKNDFKS